MIETTRHVVPILKATSKRYQEVIPNTYAWLLSGEDFYNHLFKTEYGFVPSTLFEAYLLELEPARMSRPDTAPYECLVSECSAVVPVAMRLPYNGSAHQCLRCKRIATGIVSYEMI
jgi:hypothetical protein